MTLHLVSHTLCPYVQRAAIALAEKQVPFERSWIDLSRKPDWFLKISPLGKTPVLLDNGHAIFESAVILEYLEDTRPNPLHPSDAGARARHRAWIEFGSAILNDIAGLYSAPDAGAFASKAGVLRDKFLRLERELGDGPWFDGTAFSLVDAVFGPVFRYFDAFERISAFGILDDLPKLAAWRLALAARPSVAGATVREYPELLDTFLRRKGSYVSSMMERNAA